MERAVGGVGGKEAVGGAGGENGADESVGTQWRRNRFHFGTRRIEPVEEEDDEAIPDTKNSKNIFREQEKAKKRAEREKLKVKKDNFNNIFKQGDRPTPTKE